MKLIRLFIAILIPPVVQKELHRIQTVVQESGVCQGTYPVPETSHITLQFIGSVEEKEIAPITKALQPIQCSPFEISFTAIDYFSRRGTPSVLYLTAASQELSRLAQEVKTILHPWLAKNDREFVGHLTVMRIKNMPDEKKVAQLVSTLSLPPLSFQVRSFSLMQSELGPKGPFYSEITLIPLMV